VATTICDAKLNPVERSLGKRQLAPGTILARALCANPTPGRERAVKCSAIAKLPPIGTGVPAAVSEVSPPLDCDHIPPEATNITLRKARRFAQNNDGGQEITVPLKLNSLARDAIKAYYRARGQASVLVCVTFSFNDGTSVTLTKNLQVSPQPARTSPRDSKQG